MDKEIFKQFKKNKRAYLLFEGSEIIHIRHVDLQPHFTLREHRGIFYKIIKNPQSNKYIIFYSEERFILKMFKNETFSLFEYKDCGL